MKTAIEFTDISKLYRLGEIGSGTLSHDLQRFCAKLLNRPDPFEKVGESNDRTMAAGRNSSRSQNQPYVWALRDISFSVGEGDVLGIIGRNGAGKSTLLKLLSRVTAPTTGTIKARGRIASLLEVGTGFHPELSGRENIYLNGAILGMRRYEIAKRLDEIIDFSGCNKYIDTPVKRYSSGMLVRLGFSVAAHLNCEILVVDEVLAVGDIEFQRKCIGKMKDVSRFSGKTVLFVSHNISAVSNLTNRSIILANGELEFAGHTEDAISRYLASASRTNARWQSDPTPEKPICFLTAEISNSSEQPSSELAVQKDITLRFSYEVSRPLTGATIAVILHSIDDSILFSSEDIDAAPELLLSRVPGVYSSTITIPRSLLNKGSYYVRLATGIPSQGQQFDTVEALRFSLVDLGDQNARGHRSGYFLPSLEWCTERES